MAGTIKLQRERCVHSGDDTFCESDERRVELDLYWDGHGPITERFIYFRETRKNCESTFSGTERSRDAAVSGQIGAKPVGLGGAIVRHDLQETRVCTSSRASTKPLVSGHSYSPARPAYAAGGQAGSKP